MPLAIIFSSWESGYAVRYNADFSWQMVIGALVIAFTHGGAFIKFAFTLAERNVEFCPSVVIDEEAERHNRISR